MSEPIGCQSHGCLVSPPKGMGHNGPCRCVDWRGLREIQRLRAALDREREAVAQAREVVGRLNPWTGYDASGDRRTMRLLTVKDYAALRRALGMEVDHE